MNILRAVMTKELLDGVRDKRALMSAFLFPFLAPLFIYGLMTLVIEQNTKSERVTLPVIGAEYAPTLIERFVENGFIIETFEAVSYTHLTLPTIYSV